MRFHWRFIKRELARPGQQALIVILCVGLSLLTLVALQGFTASVDRSLLADARQLNAADIIIRSRAEITTPLHDTVRELEQQGAIRAALTLEFYSLVRSIDNSRSLMAQLKVVAPGYPFYGSVKLASGHPFQERLTPGGAVVEQNLLERLGLTIGDPLQVGDTVLRIRDVVTAEPDRPMSFASFGPRVFIALQDLTALNLIGQKSRVRYSLLVQVPDDRQLQPLADQLSAKATPEREQVETFRTAESRVKRFFDNLLLFLQLIAIFTLILSGIGIHSAVTALIRERQDTIAIMRALGADNRFIARHFLLILTTLGAIGAALGVIGGVAVERVVFDLFETFLPPSVTVGGGWMVALKGLGLGLLVVFLFAFPAIHAIRDIKPVFILRTTAIVSTRSTSFYLAWGMLMLLFAGMVMQQLRDWTTGIWFLGGAAGFILVILLVVTLLLRGMRQMRIVPLAPRQALKGLFRPRNATRSVMVTLAASLTVVLTLFLLERNLDAAFVDAYPEDAPNLFFIDIQPSQKEAFHKIINQPATFFPIVRARILAINNTPINRKAERRRRGDNLARTFNLTYRHHLLDSERLVAGDSLFQQAWTKPQVSILDTVAEIGDISIGDHIRFRIQGVPIEARVSSIRTRLNNTISPYFYFVFPETVLKPAPHTLFTALRLAPKDIAELQNRVAARFPNVSVINVNETITVLATLMKKLSGIIRFLTFFSILAGVLIIISSVFATRFARMQESVYYQVLGARRRFVMKVFALENLIIGSLSALTALVIAQIAAWLITTHGFDITYRLFPFSASCLALSIALAVTAVGLLPNLTLLRRKPITFLRMQTDE